MDAAYPKNGEPRDAVSGYSASRLRTFKWAPAIQSAASGLYI